MATIIIKVQGGMVQDVYTDSKEDIDVEIWDEDMDYDDEERIANNELLKQESENMLHIY